MIRTTRRPMIEVENNRAQDPRGNPFVMMNGLHGVDMRLAAEVLQPYVTWLIDTVSAQLAYYNPCSFFSTPVRNDIENDAIQERLIVRNHP